MSYDNLLLRNPSGGGIWVSSALTGQYAATNYPPGMMAFTSDLGLMIGNGSIWQGAILPQGAASGISNFTAQNTIHLRAAVARVKAGTGIAKIAVIGDSTTFGAYSNGSIYTGDKPLAYPAQLATQLAAKGIPATNCSFFGSGNLTPATAAGYNLYNAAVTMTGGFAPGNIPTLGAFPMTSTTNGATLAYVPENSFQFDTADIYYLGGTGGAFTVNVDGGSTLATITPTGTHVMQKTTVTGITLGTHTLNCVTSSSTGVYIVGIAVRASGTDRVEVYNMGWNAVVVLNAAAPTNSYAQPTSSTYQYNYFTSLPVLAPDCTIINLTINDINNQTETVASYQAALQTMVVQAQVSGDCILMIGNPGNTVAWTGGIVAPQYQAAVYAVAQATNVPVCDLTQRWVSYAVTNPVMAYGDAGANALHPGTVGNADIATALLEFFN